MRIETLGGFDYAGADCTGWPKEAGFREARVEYLAGPVWLWESNRPSLA